MPKLLLLLLTLAFAFSPRAAPLAPVARTEVNALLSALEYSGCEFSRNGSWYSGSEAKTHLLRKLEYLEGKNLVQSTEQFIELGASTSSSSGKPYLVRCGDAGPIESRKWLGTQLTILRAPGGAAASSPR